MGPGHQNVDHRSLKRGPRGADRPAPRPTGVNRHLRFKSAVGLWLVTRAAAAERSDPPAEEGHPCQDPGPDGDRMTPITKIPGIA